MPPPWIACSKPLNANPVIRTVFLEGGELLDLSRDLAADGKTLLYQGQPQGGSMRPFIWPGDRIVVERAGEEAIRIKDILVFRNGGGHLVAHRLLRIEGGADACRYVARGDACRREDPPFAYADIVGKVVRILRGKNEIQVDGWWTRRLVDFWLFIHPLPHLAWGAFRFLRNGWAGSRRKPF